MFRNRAMLAVGFATLVLLAPLVVSLGFMKAQEKTGKDAKRDVDRAAIDKLTKQMIDAFNKADATAIVANWTADGEYIRNDGEPVSGRAAVQKGYADYFKTLKSKPNVEVKVEGLRFPSADTAVSEVTLRLKDDEGEVIGSSWRTTTLVREGGQWKVASVREWDRDTSLDVGLAELDWLIGTWQASTKDREVTLTYAWDEHKAFIRGKYTVKQGDKVIESGTQMIGKDNVDSVIRSWVFQSDGGFGSGVWTREGKKWSVEVYGARADGKQLTATTIYVRVDPNSFTWQATGQALDGAPIADTKPLKVTKQK